MLNGDIISTLLIIDISIISFLYLFYPISLYIIYFARRLFSNKYTNIMKNENNNNIIFPTITFIVPCYNEEKNLKNKIKNILELDYPKDKLRILIVNDGSIDDTEKIGKYLENKYKNIVKYIHKSENTGKIDSINVALKQVNTEWIAISDADSNLDKNTLNHAIKLIYEDINVGGVAGRSIPHKGESLIESLYADFFKIRDYFRYLEGKVDTVSIVSGTFYLFKKSLIDKFKGDFSVAFSIRERGFKMISTNKPVAKEGRSPFFHRKTYLIKNVVEDTLKFRIYYLFRLFRFKNGIFGLYIYPMSTLQILLSPILFSLLAILLIINIVLDPLVLLYVSFFLLLLYLSKNGRVIINASIYLALFPILAIKEFIMRRP